MIFALRFMIEEEPIINCKARDILASWVEKFRFFSFMKILEKEFRKRGVENSSTIRTFLHASTTFNTNFRITHDLFFQFNGFNGTNFNAVLTLCTQFVDGDRGCRSFRFILFIREISFHIQNRQFFYVSILI